MPQRQDNWQKDPPRRIKNFNKIDNGTCFTGRKGERKR